MAIIDSDKYTRRRKPLDPSQYPAAAPVGAQGPTTAPAQAPVAAPQPQIAQQQAQAPVVAPVQAQAQPEPVLDLSGVPGYERAELEARVAAAGPTGGPIQSAPGPTDEARKAEYERVDNVQFAAVKKGWADRVAETDRMRVRRGLKPLMSPAPAGQAPTPVSVFGDPTDDSNLDEALANNAVLKRLDADAKRDQSRTDKRGGVVTPEIKARAEKRAKTAEDVRASATETYQAEQAEKATKAKRDDEKYQADKAKAAALTDKNKRLSALKKAAVPQIGAANKAMTAKDYDRAITIADNILNGDKDYELPDSIRTDLNQIRAKAMAAKASIEEKAKVAATTKAAAKLIGKIKDYEFRYKEANDVVKAAEDNALFSDIDVAPLKQAREDIRKELIGLISRKAVLDAGLEPDPPAPTQPVVPTDASQADLDALPSVASQADFDALPSGSEFIGPDGMTRRKP